MVGGGALVTQCEIIVTPLLGLKREWAALFACDEVKCDVYYLRHDAGATPAELS